MDTYTIVMKQRRMTMNNFKEIRLTHYQGTTEATAKFTDGDDSERRYRNVTPSSVERLQNAIIRNGRSVKDFTLRLPIGYGDIGWVANRR
jgi:hypothetical protein